MPNHYRRAAVACVVALDITLTVLGCSSDKPPSGGGGSLQPPPAGNDGSFVGVDAGVSADADAGDAAGDADAQIANCVGDQPLADAGDTSCPGAGCGTFCDRIGKNFRQGVGQRALACVSKLSACNGPAEVIPCVDLALLGSCADPTSPAFCKPIVGPCLAQGGSIDEFGCEQFANGLSDAGKLVFGGCVHAAIDAGTCGMDIEACADGIRQ